MARRNTSKHQPQRRKSTLRNGGPKFTGRVYRSAYRSA